jgi:DNA replication protein DnaD
MPASMFNYTKTVLESVSFDKALFCKEVEKALKMLLPYELEQLVDWLYKFTTTRPELQSCLSAVENTK